LKPPSWLPPIQSQLYDHLYKRDLCFLPDKPVMKTLLLPDILWDGSNLGDLDLLDIKWNIKKENRTVWIFKWKEQNIACEVVNIQNNIPCVLDEMKYIFGIPKIGTHTVTHGKKIYLLKRIRSENRSVASIILDKSINNYIIDMNNMISNQIREILVFRQVCGINPTHESKIVIREGYDQIYPLSWEEKGITMNREDSVLSSTLFSKWFDDTTFYKTLHTLLKITENENSEDNEYYSLRLMEIRIDIENIINRLDSNLIWFVDYIIYRAQHYLYNS